MRNSGTVTVRPAGGVRAGAFGASAALLYIKVSSCSTGVSVSSLHTAMIRRPMRSSTGIPSVCPGHRISATDASVISAENRSITSPESLHYGRRAPPDAFRNVGQPAPGRRFFDGRQSRRRIVPARRVPSHLARVACRRLAEFPACLDRDGRPRSRCGPVADQAANIMDNAWRRRNTAAQARGWQHP